MSRRLLITGGRVLHPEDALDQPPVQDLLIVDGRIAAVGEAAGGQAGGAERLDAAGCLVTPGFVNAHSHSHDVLLRGLYEALPLEAWGLTAFPSGWPRRSAEEVGLRATLHAAECLRGGITTVQDMVTIVGPDRPHADAVLDAYDAAGIRCVLALQFGDRGAAEALPFIEENLGLPGASDPVPMQRFVRELLDARVGSRLTWGLGPSAPQRCSEPVLAWVAALAREQNLPVFTHVYETRSQAVLARERYRADGGSLITHLARVGLLQPNLVIAHGVWIGDEEIRRLGTAGVHLACNPGANLKLLNGTAPIRRYADAGAGIALGCDNSSASDVQNIFQSMKTFALAWALQSPTNEPGAAAQAFRAATLGGAMALGLAGRVGTLRPGAQADLVLFDLTDPAWWPMNSAVRQLVYTETGRSIRAVLVDGDVLVRNGQLVGMDAAGLAQRAEAARVRMANDLAALQARNQALFAAMLDLHDRCAAYPLDIDRLRIG